MNEKLNADIDELVSPVETPNDMGSPLADDILIDSAGIAFDPELHSVKRDGSPSYTRSGRFRKVRRVKTLPNVPEIDEDDRRFRVAAEGTVAAIEMAGTVLGGDSFRYIRDRKLKIDERASGIDAFTAYYKAKDIEDFPPGIIVAIWAISYAAPRFAQQEVRNRMSNFGKSIGKGFKRVRKFVMGK